ncbi:hypothetical protein BIW11_11315 [Tropilaelaps mercedesae]|uniref:Uncharacterized protein n=1 Tax=Tropilaelaps mercedesae TaxID=418985 RepID=A0A1V9XC26_9ACAR|nr:hypothetical protein BIW11_11315 [Tropilaelaps mercedesae]
MAVAVEAICSLAVSLTLTLLAAGALLWPRALPPPPPPLWCFYDTDNPFDVARSGQLCDMIVVCCLVDERAFDAMTELVQRLGHARLDPRVLVMPWRAGEDVFWRQLCHAHVTSEFIDAFLAATRGLQLAGVVRAYTSDCPAEAAFLEERLLRLAQRHSTRRPVKAAVWDAAAEMQKDVNRCNSASHVLIWWEEPLDGSTKRCHFNVSRSVTAASAARRFYQHAAIVHVVPASWSLVHENDPHYRSADVLVGNPSTDQRTAASNPSCGAYPIRGSRSVYIRPMPRVLRQLVARLVSVDPRTGGALLVTHLADDEAAADSVGRPQATILRQMYRILRERIVSY